MTISKQKVLEKTIPPNPDLMKLIYQQFCENKLDYEALSDEQLKTEKQRLLKLLKEEENDC